MHPDLEHNQGPTPTRLLANKYRSVDELERGYTELQRVSNESYTKLQTLEQRLNDMERVNPAEQAAGRRDPRELLDEVGVPASATAGSPGHCTAASGCRSRHPSRWPAQTPPR